MTWRCAVNSWAETRGKTTYPGAGGLTAVLNHDRCRRCSLVRSIGIAGAS